MARIDGKCIGDCSRCDLLASGEVDMIPCILDQIFARVRKQGEELEEIKRKIGERAKNADIQLVGIDFGDKPVTTKTEEEV